MLASRFARFDRRQSAELVTPDKGTAGWWEEHPEAYGSIAAVLGVIGLLCIWVLWRDQRKLPILPWRKSKRDKVPASSDQSVRNTTYTMTNASRTSRTSRYSNVNSAYRYSTYYPEQAPGTPPPAPADWRDEDGNPAAVLPERKRSISVYSNDSFPESFPNRKSYAHSQKSASSAASGSPGSGPVPLPAVAYPYRQRNSHVPNVPTSPPPAVSYPHPVPYPAPPRSAYKESNRRSQPSDFTPPWAQAPALAVTPPLPAQSPTVAMPAPRPASAAYSSLTVQPQGPKRLSASPHQRHTSMTLPTVPSPLARVTSQHEVEEDPIAAAGRKLAEGTNGTDGKDASRSQVQRSPRSPRFSVPHPNPNSPPLPTSPTSPSASRVSVDYHGSPGRTRSLSSLGSPTATSGFHTPPTSPPLYSPSPPLPPGAAPAGPVAARNWHQLRPGPVAAPVAPQGRDDGGFAPPQRRARERREASIDLGRPPSTHAL